MKTKKTYVLYHANCADGFGAAWAAWHNFRNAGIEAIYLAVFHGQNPPPMERDSGVYILDFSYPRAILEVIYEQSSFLRVIDHHATAAADLAGAEYATFDLTKSGARLAWEYFFPAEPLPEILAYVEDRDLWKWALPDSKEINAAIRSYPFEFEVWDDLQPALSEPVGFDAMIAEGEACLRLGTQMARACAAEAVRVEIEGYEVPMVNCSDQAIASEVAKILLEMFPEAAFAGYYFDRRDGMRQFGVRSRKAGERGNIEHPTSNIQHRSGEMVESPHAGFDCSVIAKRFGGGGHPQAAGWQFPAYSPFRPVGVENIEHPTSNSEHRTEEKAGEA